MSESEGTEVTGGVTALGAEVIVYSQVCAHRELIADPSATAMPRRPKRLQMLKFANIFHSLVYILEYHIAIKLIKIPLLEIYNNC